MTPEFDPSRIPEPSPPPTPPAPPSEPEPFWGYLDLAVFAGAVLPCMLLAFGLVKGLQLLLHWNPSANAIVLLLAQSLGYVLLFGVLAFMFRAQGHAFWYSLSWTFPTNVPSWSIAIAGFTTALVVSILGGLIGTPNSENELTKLMKDPLSLMLMAGFGVFIAPLCEELGFRGFLQPLFVRSVGPVGGILLAALPFGLLHYREYGNSWKHALLITVAGAAFGAMRHVARSTLASTIMHASYNALFFAVFFVARRI